MIAKNKGDFLYNLHNELHRIGIDDDEEIAADFEEHFNASQEEGFTEEETCEKLGDIKEIARNYLDIESTRLNSIVANAISNQRVSLTKPGASLPADLSLVKEVPPEQPPMREYTPEHIAEEPVSPAPASQKINLVKEEKLPEYTPQHIAPEQPAPTPESSVPKMTDERYKYNSNSREGEIPPQCVPPVGNNAKTGGFKFSDLKNMKPDINAGKLIGCILMDVLLWSWLVPFVISAIIGGLGSVAISLFGGGFKYLFDGGNYYFISRFFLCTGMVSGAVLVICAICALCKAVFHWIKSIVISHIKAIYNI